MSEEGNGSEEDHEGDSIALLADLAAASPTEFGNQQMYGDLPNNTKTEEDVPICHQLDIDMIDTATAELGEVNDEHDIVL